MSIIQLMRELPKEFASRNYVKVEFTPSNPLHVNYDVDFVPASREFDRVMRNYWWAL